MEARDFSRVRLHKIHEVNGEHRNVCMILFHGKMDTDFFHGKILPGGVDTQVGYDRRKRTLSARYILKGTDAKGKECSIFVENNGTVEEDNEILTKPTFVTDSSLLKWLEETEYIGKIFGKSEKELEIRIYEYKK